jgi:hypothetical protein
VLDASFLSYRVAPVLASDSAANPVKGKGQGVFDSALYRKQDAEWQFPQ